MIDETLFEAEEKMDKAVEVAKDDFATIRTGPRQPRRCSARSSSTTTARPTPLQQLASFTTPEARTILITPYDQSLDARRSRRRCATPTSGVNPTNDGNVIRVVLPAADRGAPQGLRQARPAPRREDARVSVRNVRRKAKEELDRIVKDGEAGEDEVAGPRRSSRR